MLMNTYIHIFWHPANMHTRIPTSYTPDCTYMHILWHPRNRHTYSDSLHTGLHAKSVANKHIFWHPTNTHTRILTTYTPDWCVHAHILTPYKYTCPDILYIYTHVFSRLTHQIVRKCICCDTLDIHTHVFWHPTYRIARKEQIKINTYIYMFSHPTNTRTRILTSYSPECTYMRIFPHPRYRHTYSDSLRTGLHVKSDDDKQPCQRIVE